MQSALSKEPAMMNPETQSTGLSSMNSQRSNRILRVLFGLLVLAIFTNGLYFWLQKSQLVPSSTYQDFLLANQDYYDGKLKELPKLNLDGFYVVPRQWMVTKLLKDVFIFSFALASLFFLRRSHWSASAALIPLALLGLSFLASLVYSLQQYGVWVATAGVRPLIYLAAGLIGIWVARKPASLELLCRFLLAVLVLELLMGLYEYAFGLPLFNTARLSNRINGSFSFPTSLGIFAVVVFVLGLRFSGISKALLLGVAAPVVYMTGSATALVLFLVAGAIWVHDLVPDSWKRTLRLALLGFLFVVALIMPKMVARSDVFDSLWGRVEFGADYIRHAPPGSAILFGKGLGIGSNIVNSVVMQSGDIAEPEGVELIHARADSTPLALVNQIGIIGTLLFYLVIAVAAWRDPRAGPVYLILCLASLTVNLLELFPMNFILGLLLCHSLLTERPENKQLNTGADCPP